MPIKREQDNFIAINKRSIFNLNQGQSADLNWSQIGKARKNGIGQEVTYPMHSFFDFIS